MREEKKTRLSAKAGGKGSSLSPSELSRCVARAKKGDIEAFQELYEAFGKKILNFILRLTGSRQEAEDLTQDTFILAYKNLNSLKKNERFQSWLFRIAQNNVYQMYRSRKAQVTSLDEQEDLELPGSEKIPSQTPDPEEQALSLELEEMIEQVIAELPEKYKTVFILSAIHRLSYKEISEIVGRSLASVKSDIHRARVDVRDRVKNYLGKTHGMSRLH